MKIAIWHNLPSGGGKRALFDQVRELVRRGHTVASWCPPTADQKYLPLSDAIVEQIVPLHSAAQGRLERKLRLPVSVERSLAAMEEHCRQCAAAIDAGGFDILLAHPCMFFRTTPIARFVAMPTVLYQQEPYRWLYEAMPRLPWLAPVRRVGTKRPVHKRLRDTAEEWRRLQNTRMQGRDEIENAAAFDRILVNSLFSRESVLRAYGLSAEVCYLGVDTSHFVDQGLPRESLLVGLGAFVREKNIRLIVEAVALLPEPRPTLAWIGNVADQVYLDELTAFADAGGVRLEPHVRIDDEAVISLLNRASAMVYAPRLEPFGLAPLEGGACGLPVVAVAEGGVRETVIHERTGLLVQHHAAAIAGAVARLLDDPPLARSLGAAGRKNAVENWSLDMLGTRIETALASVLEDARTAQARALPPPSSDVRVRGDQADASKRSEQSERRMDALMRRA